jgi:hypothetical protein
VAGPTPGKSSSRSYFSSCCFSASCSSTTIVVPLG